MSDLKRFFLPHQKHGHRAHSISHLAIASYALGIFFLGLTIQKFTDEGKILAYATDIQTEEIVELTNEKRAEANLDNLAINEKLEKAAAKKAEHMFANDYWAHIAPDGTTPWVFIKQEGYEFQSAGENLARDFDNSDGVVEAWMNSPTHRENILTKQYQEIGVAVVNGTLGGQETTLVVQFFGTPKIAISKDSSGTPVTVSQESAKTNESEIRPVGAPFIGRILPITEAKSTLHPISFQGLIRSLTIIFLLFLLALFALDYLVVVKNGIVKFRGNTLAHLGLLLFLLMAILYSSGGMIL